MVTSGNGKTAVIRELPTAASPAGIELEVEAIRLHVRLGCQAAERAAAQAVDVNVVIRCAALPAACWTDELEDSVCYAELATLLREHCAPREFRLVERLALELHGLVRSRLPKGARLALTVTKLAPPVAELERGVRFTIDER